MTSAARSTQSPLFNVASARADFPILTRMINGKPLIYFDSAASAQKPTAVLGAMTDFAQTHYSNVHRGLYTLANEATTAFESARQKVAHFIGAASPDTIIFTRSATEAINLVAQSFGGLVINEGDEIVLSIMEHHSNIVPWHFHRERRGVVLKFVDVNDDGGFDLQKFEDALSPRTKMVAITHVSNVLGTITPIKDIIRIAHARGIPVLVDGSQAAVHLPVNVADLDADFYVFTGHKVYGPTGIGVLYAKPEHLDAMPPFQGGGEMIETVTSETVTYNHGPHKFEAGTPPIIEAVGLGAAIDYLGQFDKAALTRHENKLTQYASQKLSAISDVRLIGTTSDKAPILSFEIKNIHAHDIATVLDQSGIAIRAGTHCAMPLLQRFGCTSTCRASFGLYNMIEEVDIFVDALQKAKTLFL